MRLNSYPSSATYMLQWIGSALVQVMACRLFGVKPLPELMLTYCHLSPKGQTVKLESKYTIFIYQNIFKDVCEMAAILSRRRRVDLTHYSVGPSDATWRQKTVLTLTQVMACCLTAPSHYLNQCWLIITDGYWHSSEGNFAASLSAINHCNWLKKYSSKISLKSPRPQWVNTCADAWWHIYIRSSNRAIIGSSNGSALVRHQALPLTDAGTLRSGPLGINSS